MPAVSKRSLTPSVRPASGPARCLVLGIDPRDERVQVVGAHEGTSATASTSTFAPSTARRDTSTSVLAGRVAPNTSWRTRVDRRPVVDVGEEDRDLDDVLEAAARGGEHGSHVLEDLARLGDDVVSSDEASVAVDGDDPGHEEQVAGPHGIGEVRDRLGEPRRRGSPRRLIPARSCSSLSRTRGLIRSGSTGELEQRGLPGGERALERGLEVLGSLDPLAEAAVRLRESDEVRVLEIGADRATRVLALLVHPDRREHPVVHEQDDDRQVVLHRGRELGRAHHEVAVTGEAERDPVRVDELRRDRRRDPVAHRAAPRAGLGPELRELGEAVRPHGEVSRAAGLDGVAGEPLAKKRHHLAEVERSLHRLVAQVRLVVRPGSLASPPSAARRDRVARGQRRTRAGRETIARSGS